MQKYSCKIREKINTTMNVAYSTMLVDDEYDIWLLFKITSRLQDQHIALVTAHYKLLLLLLLLLLLFIIIIIIMCTREMD